MGEYSKFLQYDISIKFEEESLIQIWKVKTNILTMQAQADPL